MSRGPSKPYREVRTLCPILVIWNLNWAVDIHEVEGLGKTRGCSVSLSAVRVLCKARKATFPRAVLPQVLFPGPPALCKCSIQTFITIWAPLSCTRCGEQCRWSWGRKWQDQICVLKRPFRKHRAAAFEEIVRSEATVFQTSSFPCISQGRNFLSSHGKRWNNLPHGKGTKWSLLLS